MSNNLEHHLLFSTPHVTCMFLTLTPAWLTHTLTHVLTVTYYTPVTLSLLHYIQTYSQLTAVHSHNYISTHSLDIRYYNNQVLQCLLYLQTTALSLLICNSSCKLLLASTVLHRYTTATPQLLHHCYTTASPQSTLLATLHIHSTLWSSSPCTTASIHSILHLLLSPSGYYCHYSTYRCLHSLALLISLPNSIHGLLTTTHCSLDD